MKIAVVGAGIAGLGAAYELITRGRHEVTVFEASARAGGHVHTVVAEGHAIDMGFIVCNRERYPNFFALLAELGVATRPTTMAFSVSLPREDLEFGSASLSALFADRRKLFDRRHWRFLVEIVRFLRRAQRDLASNAITGSLDDYLARWDVDLRDRFCVPLAAALWSLAPDRCGAFPAELFVRFLDHHGMLSPVFPLAWHTVVGGSRRYVDALLALLAGSGRFMLHVDTPVRSIARHGQVVTIDGKRFDRVVIATHADTALALLADPSSDEQRVLGAITYSTNRTVLHTDRAFLPRREAAHASWNYVGDPDTSRVAVTYSMSRLQGLPDRPYLVTLEPRREPAGKLAEAVFRHPQFDVGALAAQRELPSLGGPLTAYAGAYFRFGFHEDGLRAGIAAARRIT